MVIVIKLRQQMIEKIDVKSDKLYDGGLSCAVLNQECRRGLAFTVTNGRKSDSAILYE